MMKYLTPNWQAPANIKAYTTLRTGFGNFYHETNIISLEESNRLKTLLHLPSGPIWIKQTHGTTVIEAHPDQALACADASYTREIDRVCVVLTADCLPVLICNAEGTEIAAIHAGWRGLSSGIIEATLTSLKTPYENLIAWLGPAIGPSKFEVGRDVFDAFTQKDPDTSSAFAPYKTEKWLANLYDLAKICLNKQGLSQVYGGDFCTYSQADLFFSYRRDQGKTGRMASLIWIEKAG